MSAPGWQHPATPPRPPRCPHLGLLGAVVTIGLHDVGHVWRCVCGAEWVVATDSTPDGVGKRLERRR